MRLFFTAILLIVFGFVQGQVYLPKSKGEVVKKSYYTFSYNEQHEQPNWVYYQLKSSYVNGKVKRKNNFRADPSVRTGSATPADYKKSGYDRGHLCPAAAMKMNAKAMSETFFMSNMSPQKPYFNRGVWKKLEAQVRKWACAENMVYVVTGPVFKDNKGTIGKNKVTIPGYYYKVIFDATGTKKMIAFLLPNKKSEASLQSFVVSVDKVEKITGIDFFPQLNDEVENRLERVSSVGLWKW